MHFQVVMDELYLKPNLLELKPSYLRVQLSTKHSGFNGYYENPT